MQKLRTRWTQIHVDFSILPECTFTRTCMYYLYQECRFIIHSCCYLYPLTGHSEMYSTSKTATSHGGSYTQYTEMLNKHQRNTKGPAELYRRPVSTSHTYGWWMSEGQPLKQEWTQGERRVHVNSEMTRCLTDSSAIVRIVVRIVVRIIVRSIFSFVPGTTN